MAKDANSGLRESYPLLPTTSGERHDKHGYVNRGFDSKIKISRNKDFWEDREWDDDKTLFSYDKRRGTSMIAYDCFLVLLDYLHLFSLLQSLGLRWPWPQGWIQYSSWVFLFNIDVWDFSKVYSNGTYKSVKDYTVPSAEMPYHYWQLLVGWLVVLVIAALVFAILYIVLNVHKHPYMMVHIAHLQRAYVVIVEILALPLGLMIARIFNCKPDASVTSDKQLVDVSNDVECFSDMHWAYIAPSSVVAFLLFLALPVWLIFNIKQEILAASSDQHEGFLQLKETEYIQGLDMVFVVKGYPLFSSFRLWGVYYRPTILLLKFAILVFYATLFQHTFAQSLIINLILFVALVALIIVRPFRVKPFNFMLIVNYLCLMANCLLGTMLTSFDSTTVQSPWLTPTYMTYILLLINGFWLLCVMVFLVYILLRHLNLLKRWIREPLWPSMTSRGLNKLSPETRKFMRGILRARHLLERCLAMPPIFAPVHELSRQIQIINAYCREAELLKDPIHPTLWDLLDDMIESYSKIAPKSLFSESVKDTIRQTAAELMKVMPMFVRRLAQREYDFILMKPVKRRLLLKMYCMGLFLNGRAEKVRKAQVNAPAIRKIWRKNSIEIEEEEDDGYYEDMYPEKMQGPNFQHPETLLDMGLESDSDDEFLDNLDSWAQEHPRSRGVSRLSDDLSRLLGDDISLNLSEMMAGIPSLHDSSSGSSRPASSASRLVRPLTSNSHRSSQRSANSLSMDGRMSSTPVADHKAGLRPASSKSSPNSSHGADEQPPRPRSVQRVLDESLGRPSSSQGRPVSPQAQEKRDSGQRRPDSAQQRPESARQRPGSAQERPGSAQSKPRSAHSRPDSAQQRADDAQQQPESVQDRPASGQSRPRSAQSRPGSAQLRPESAHSRAGSSNVKSGQQLILGTAEDESVV